MFAFIFLAQRVLFVALLLVFSPVAAFTFTTTNILTTSLSPVAKIQRSDGTQQLAITANLRTQSMKSTTIRSRRNSVITSSASNDDNDNPDPDPQPIDKFRNLMGSLYGVAGIAHAADCYLGQSQLLVAAGSPAYQNLPSEGQALVAIWCAAGPISYIASRVGDTTADIGLIFYGVVEVVGALVLSKYLATVGSPVAEIDAVMNAVLVQVIVLASWIYSRMKAA